MKHNHFLFIAFVCQLFAFCSKREYSEIKGKLVVSDTIFNKWISEPIRERYLYLKDDTNINTNYIYKIKTDKEGYFNFTLLPQIKDYTILYLCFDDTIEKIKYVAIKQIRQDSISVLVQANLNEKNIRYLQIEVFDSSGINRMPNCEVYLYTSELLADSNVLSNAYANAKSNNEGKILFPSVSPGKYYINSFLKVGKDSITRAKKVIQIQNSFLQKDSIWLR